MKNLRYNKESGAVSLFMVIFAMLIITIITVSFLRLMMADQRQASDNDLAQSAYDSAQAGVEDAKRALLRYQQICSTASVEDCGALSDIIESSQCNAAVAEGGIAVQTRADGTVVNPGESGEVLVQQTEGVDSALRQAYTCVTVQLETDDYVGSLEAGESKLVPLVGRTDFNTVTVRWFSNEDIAEDALGQIDLQSETVSRSLTQQSDWPANRPPVMRAQLIQYGPSFTLNSFDAVETSGGDVQSNANTAFLYPTSGGASVDAFTALDTRKASGGEDPGMDTSGMSPRAVSCVNDVTSGQYACQMSLTLPSPVGGGTARTAFLRLTPFYNAASFQVLLSNGALTSSTPIIQFKDVQPAIDSTGRANDIFRRVQSRVDLYNTNFAYPDATIDINGNFCKSFAVSDVASTYTSSVAACTP